MLFWNAQDVNLGLGIDVLEGNRVIILSDELSSKLPGNDLAKNTVQVFLRHHPKSETHREEAVGRRWLQALRLKP